MNKTIDFLQLTAKLPYPPSVKSELSTIHATVIDQFLSSFSDKYTEKLYVVTAINCISYMYLTHDSKPIGWNIHDPLHTFRKIDDEDILRESLGDMYISTKDIDWVNVHAVNADADSDVDVNSDIDSIIPVKNVDVPIHEVKPQVVKASSDTYNHSVVLDIPTDKSDLYIQSPEFPKFDAEHPWITGVKDGTTYAIYPSYPLIPTKQNEISITTDLSKMSPQDLRRLYPNCFIRTRAACMYEQYDNLITDPKLGVLIPVEGFTKQQLIDNIVRYPHIFRLLKMIDDSGEPDSFYRTIEINGELYRSLEVWNDLPESKIIPYNKEFVKEYVVRRYLLERDIKGIDHKYKLFGSLDPFLTLFTTPHDYASFGYSDVLGLAKQCVQARIDYKKTRNPILRRLGYV